MNTPTYFRNLICGLVACLGALTSGAANRPNILFIAIDDLRPELGCYGSDVAITPHMDALASDGLLFDRAYCQQAICSPSRASLMTGARPDTIGVVENYTYFRDANPDIITLPQHLWANGYETVRTGKIYHNTAFGDEEKSWSRSPSAERVREQWGEPVRFALEENGGIRAEKIAQLGADAHSALLKGPAYESADVPDQTYEDGYNTDLAIDTLKDMLQKGQEPFFLGLGLKKPHLDFIAPQRYWDLYDRDSLPIADQTEAPIDGAAMGLHASFELRTRHAIPKYGDFEPELARTLRHGYLACTSFVDAQVGRMIDALEEAGIRDNTIIIVWGDHGWHLGEMGIWGKATNYEIGTRVPLMIWTPDMAAGSRGKTTDALVELVDMYPTLCELAGVPLPAHLEGHSFEPLLDDPELEWKTAAFSQYPNPALREWAANPLTDDMRELFFGPLIRDVERDIIEQQGEKWDRELFENDLMGYAMRTDRYRLVAWKNVKDRAAPPIFVELYDHEEDPTETANVAAQNPRIVNQLLAQLEAGWRGSLPSQTN